LGNKKVKTKENNITNIDGKRERMKEGGGEME
jgi:hypothetical protein